VVDNASTDESVHKVREKYGDKVRLIVNSENLGGSGGFNTGLRAAYKEGYPYLMCVDNDAMLDENAVGNLMAFLDEHTEVGIAASRIYNLDAPEYIQTCGQIVHFENYENIPMYVNKLDDGTLPDYIYVDAVPACSLMIRRTVIDQIGFMPEENFVYWDDTEWCYRCILTGMKVASVGTSKAFHALGSKANSVNTFPTYYFWRNGINFYAKHTPDENLTSMTVTFLARIFDKIYEGKHKGEYNEANTIMFDYDDAIHGVMGKAGDNRIFDIDFNPEPFIKLFSSGTKFYLENGGFPAMAEWLKGLSTLPEISNNNVTWVDSPATGVKTIALCESIFHIEDLSLSKVYIDINHCILQDEDDALDVINYNYSKRSFIMAQQPVFLQNIRERRRG
jgi:hypothetical protein